MLDKQVSLFRFPPIPKELVEMLERLYPDRCPDSDTCERDLWVRVGEVRVVRKLRQVYNDQNKVIR